MIAGFSNIKSLSCNLQKASSLFLFANLPFYFNDIQKWAIIIFVTLTFTDTIINQRWKKIDFKSKPAIICYLLISQFFLLFLYYPLEQTTTHFAVIAENRLSFIFFGIIGLFYTKEKINYKPYAYTAMVVSLGIIAYVTYRVGIKQLLEFDQWNTSFHITRHQFIQAHMAVNVYFSATLLLLIQLIKDSEKVWQRFLYTVPACIIYFTMINSDGRVGLIAANIIALTGVIYLLNNRKVIISLIPGLCIIAVMAIIMHPKTQATFNKDSNPRVWIWKIAVEEITDNPYIGYGANTAAETMREGMLNKEEFLKLNDIGLIENLKNSNEILGSHPHNQILQSWLEYGILGLIVIISLLILPINTLLSKKNTMLTICFWCILILQLMTETIHTSVGEVAFNLYLLLLLQTGEDMMTPDNSKL